MSLAASPATVNLTVETVRQVADRGLHGMVLSRLTESSINVSSGPFDVLNHSS